MFSLLALKLFNGECGFTFRYVVCFIVVYTPCVVSFGIGGKVTLDFEQVRVRTYRVEESLRETVGI